MRSRARSTRRTASPTRPSAASSRSSRSASAAAGIGHLNQYQDNDGAVRQEPLLVNYYGHAVPSMALLASIKSLNLNSSDVRLNPGESVQIGKLRVKTDEAR
jgi:hypothetical protein